MAHPCVCVGFRSAHQFSYEELGEESIDEEEVFVAYVITLISLHSWLKNTQQYFINTITINYDFPVYVVTLI